MTIQRRSGAVSDLPERIVVDQHGHYWCDFGDYWSMCPVSEENVDTEVVATYIRAGAAPRAEGLEREAAAATPSLDPNDEATPFRRGYDLGLHHGLSRAAAATPSLDVERLARALIEVDVAKSIEDAALAWWNLPPKTLAERIAAEYEAAGKDSPQDTPDWDSGFIEGYNQGRADTESAGTVHNLVDCRRAIEEHNDALESILARLDEGSKDSGRPNEVATSATSSRIREVVGQGDGTMIVTLDDGTERRITEQEYLDWPRDAGSATVKESSRAPRVTQPDAVRYTSELGQQEQSDE